MSWTAVASGSPPKALVASSSHAADSSRSACCAFVSAVLDVVVDAASPLSLEPPPEYPMAAMMPPTSARVRTTVRTAFFTRSAGSLLQDLPDEDADLVEDRHGDRHGEQRVRVLAGRDHCRDHEDDDDGRPPPLAELLARHHPGQFEEHEQDRELEG